MAEIAKRHQLKEQIRAEMIRPLGEQPLSQRESRLIAERVRTGRMRQSVFPGNGGKRTLV